MGRGTKIIIMSLKIVDIQNREKWWVVFEKKIGNYFGFFGKAYPIGGGGGGGGVSEKLVIKTSVSGFLRH